MFKSIFILRTLTPSELVLFFKGTILTYVTCYTVLYNTFLRFFPGVAYLGVARAFNLYPFSLILAKNNSLSDESIGAN